MDVLRTSSSRHDEVGVVAFAPGFGAGWAALDSDAEQPTADITLPRERVIHGRLFDLQGQPARNVKLSVTAMRRGDPVVMNFFREGFEGPAFWWTHPDDMPGWPGPAISDDHGRFTVHGIGSGVRAFITVVDPRFHNQVIETDPDADFSTRPLSVALQAARTITGRVTYADTGKPAPGAQVRIVGFDQLHRGLGPRPVITTTDDEGRFHANPGPGAEGSVFALAPTGQPYLPTARTIDLPKGTVSFSADLALPRGKLIRGQVTEHGSGQPVASAVVTCYHNRAADNSEGVGGRQARPVETKADGSFELVASNREGYLVVRGPPTTTTFAKSSTKGWSLMGSPTVRACTFTHSSRGNQIRPAKVKP